MPTRMYLPAQGAAQVSPAPAVWNDFSTFDRLMAVTARSGTAFVTKSSPPPASAAWTILMRQYVTAPLAAQTISGSLKGIIRIRTGGIDANTYYGILGARVVSRDGLTVRGTLLAPSANPHTTAAPTSGTTLTNRKFPNAYAGAGQSLTSVTALLGDRIVLELGYYTGTWSSTDGLEAEFGDAGSVDLSENETGTSQQAPWVEFSGTITFESGSGAAVDPGTGYVAVSGVVGAPRKSVPWKWILCDRTGTYLADLTQTIQPGATLTAGRRQALTVTGKVTANDVRVSGIHTDTLARLSEGRVLKGFRYEAGTWQIRAAAYVISCNDVSDDVTTQFVAADPWAELSQRFCRNASGDPGASFDAPAGEIVRALIDNQNLLSNTGVQTAGTAIPSLPNQVVTFDGNKSVTQAIFELAATAGFDVWLAPIDHTDGYLCRLVIQSTMGNDKPDVVLAWDTHPHTASRMSRLGDVSKMANVVEATGKDGILATATDGGSVSTYGRKEVALSATDVDDASYLASRSSARIEATPPLNATGTPMPGLFPEPWLHWFVGDTIRIRAGARLRGGFASRLRVEQFSVGFNANGYEAVDSLTTAAGTDAVPVLNDDFERADTAPGTLGTAPTGQTWGLTGSGFTTAKILSGRYVCPSDNVYAYVDLGTAPSRLSGVVSWTGTGASVGEAVLIASPYGTLLETMMHVQFFLDSYVVQVRVASGAFVTILSTNYITPCATDGTPYNVGWFLVGDTITVTGPDGRTGSVTDSRIGICNGRWITYQLLNPATGIQARFDSVAAYTNP